MRWGMMAIITIGLLIAGAYGAMVAHGGDSKVEVNAYLIKGEEKTTEIAPGDNVKIAVEVKNVGDTPFALSGHAPVFAYANIYKYVGGELVKIDSAKYESKYVMWHVVNLDPGKSYTAYIDWTVPENASGIIYIEAWAGSAPKTNMTVNVAAPEAQGYSNEMLFVYTDSTVYFPGDVVHIIVVNHGDQIAMFGSGFEVVDDNGNVVTQKVWRHEVILHPGESVEYTWVVPDDMPSGWYYIYVEGDSAVIYIY